MSLTDATFHRPMSWFNAAASKNIERISLTDATFHRPMFWLNAKRLLANR
jgi:hypothetical protein